MRENQFRIWLENEGYTIGTINSRLSNCIRIEQFEGDLDEHFNEDKCAKLLERLTYSIDDERYSKAPLHCIPIVGNIRNGTATLKQALGLYMRFCSSAEKYKSSISETFVDRSEKTKKVLDSYAQFIDYFDLDKEDFYSFGIKNTVYADSEKALRQWQELKNRLYNNQKIAIRGYGRQGKHTSLYFDFYEYTFGNTNIYEDPTNNTAPRRNIQMVTGYRINETIFNYQCSHIFGRTKNPLLFESVWNICFTPKLFDPFTGHETKGPWPDEYQRLFKKAAFSRFENFIFDYNELVDNIKIDEKIAEFVSTKVNNYDANVLLAFQQDVLAEWSKIVL